MTASSLRQQRRRRCTALTVMTLARQRGWSFFSVSGSQLTVPSQRCSSSPLRGSVSDASDAGDRLHSCAAQPPFSPSQTCLSPSPLLAIHGDGRTARRGLPLSFSSSELAFSSFTNGDSNDVEYGSTVQRQRRLPSLPSVRVELCVCVASMRGW